MHRNAVFIRVFLTAPLKEREEKGRGLYHSKGSKGGRRLQRRKRTVKGCHLTASKEEERQGGGKQKKKSKRRGRWIRKCPQQVAERTSQLKAPQMLLYAHKVSFFPIFLFSVLFLLSYPLFTKFFLYFLFKINIDFYLFILFYLFSMYFMCQICQCVIFICKYVFI